MRVYLSGPMTGMPGLNVQAFDDAEGRVHEAHRGWEIVNPSRLARLDMPADTPRSSFMAIDLHDLTEIDRRYRVDAMVLLPGWEESHGARLERDVAEACGIRVMTLEEALA